VAFGATLLAFAGHPPHDEVLAARAAAGVLGVSV
jgi:hypothetical protein